MSIRNGGEPDSHLEWSQQRGRSGERDKGHGRRLRRRKRSEP